MAVFVVTKRDVLWSRVDESVSSIKTLHKLSGREEGVFAEIVQKTDYDTVGKFELQQELPYWAEKEGVESIERRVREEFKSWLAEKVVQSDSPIVKINEGEELWKHKIVTLGKFQTAEIYGGFVEVRGEQSSIVTVKEYCDIEVDGASVYAEVKARGAVTNSDILQGRGNFLVRGCTTVVLDDGVINASSCRYVHVKGGSGGAFSCANVVVEDRCRLSVHNSKVEVMKGASIWGRNNTVLLRRGGTVNNAEECVILAEDLEDVKSSKNCIVVKATKEEDGVWRTS